MENQVKVRTDDSSCFKFLMGIFQKKYWFKFFLLYL